MVDLEGYEISDTEKKILANHNVGALILFTRNFKNPDQLLKLTQEIHTLRPDIFIAIDHEGGIVQRFQRHGFRALPAARVYGDVYDLNHEAGIALAQKYGKIMATQLLEYGIDLSLAPVLDIHNDTSNVIGKLDRAFHTDPHVVAKLGSTFIKGMNDAGMPAVAKHFPGHGSCSVDSHVAKAVNTASKEVLAATDLKPFATLIKAGIISSVMAAHVTYTAVDPDNAAGFSRIWLQEILREKLGFTGMVFSDCLSMAGADIGNMQERAASSLTAGCDMLIVCNQSRELLLELVETFKYEASPKTAEHLANFKQQMPRFIKQFSKLTNEMQ